MPAEAVMRMAFMGKYERMSAERALELGMISEIVDPPESTAGRAQELGETIAKNSPAAMAATKRALWDALEYGLTDACKVGAGHLVEHVGPSRPGRRTAGVRREARAQLATAGMTVNLASLLADHPAADADRLIHTIDRTVTAGEVRAEAAAVAAALERPPGPGGRGGAAERTRTGGDDVRRLARRRRLRPGQSAPARHRVRIE